MSYYYQYNFVSPEPLFARIQEELRSYFNTGVLDAVMFPLWVEDCIKQFRKTFLPIKHVLLQVVDGCAQLPEDFNAVREAWSCSILKGPTYQSGAAVYTPHEYEVVTVTDAGLGGYGVMAGGTTYSYTNKVTRVSEFYFQRHSLLKAGKIPNTDCPCTFNASCEDYYDIEDGFLHTNVGDGWINLTYYSNGKGEDGQQLIPDDEYIQKYIRAYIRQELFRILFDIISDETFNQVHTKLQIAEQACNDAFIRAKIEARKPTLQHAIDKIRKSYHRHDKYRIP